MSRAVAVVFFANERESRIAVGGAHSGWKRVDYTVVLQVFHHSLHRNADDAIDDFDVTIDEIKARLRSDHNLGDSTGTLIWQAAEPEIQSSFGEPATTDEGAVEAFAELQFELAQMIQA